MQAVELLHPDLPELVDAFLEDLGESWERLEAGRIEVAGQPLSIEELQLSLIDSDPVLWVECNLVERLEDGGGLWSLFDYQKPSLRFRGHVVHQDGAEVGKSREIVALILWGCLAERRGSCLIGSALDGDLDEIWDELNFQRDQNPGIARQLSGITTKPYRRLSFRSGLKALFRPAGHDGRAFRGIHVRGRLLHDEAAKILNGRSWNEFWRAAKPGAEIRIYSVPTGDRLCRFQQIADGAIPSEQVLPATWSARDTLKAMRRGSVADYSTTARASADFGRRVWVRFHWPKTIMPAPFWDDSRRQEFLELYGGPDEPGYVHNVLGLPGDPEQSVFPARLLDPVVRYDPLYRTISLRWDHRAHRLEVEVRRLNPTAEATEGAVADADDENEREAPAISPYVVERRESLDVAGWLSWPIEDRRRTIADLARSLVSPLPGETVAGIDVASTSVTEILVERNELLRILSLRLHLVGWNWEDQRILIVTLAEVLRLGGIGLDGTGAGGPLRDFLSVDLGHLLSAYVFNARTEAIDPDTGETQIDPQSGRPVSIPYKELGTQLLERALQRVGVSLPCDPEVLHLLQNHTYAERGGQRSYSKVNDHLADAWRCLALRLLTALYGAGAPTDAPTAVPAGARLTALSGLAGYH